LRQQQPVLDALGLTVLVVTFEPDSAAGAYVRETGLLWPLLIDTSRALYRAYGMHRGRWQDIWAPATWWAYARLAVRGHWPIRRPAGDVAQLGGDVLIDPAGIVRVHHVGSGPADRPAVTALLRVVREGAHAAP
jgi:hypothetical protein